MSSKPDQVSAVMSLPDGARVIVLSDGTSLELTPADVDILKLSFVGECDVCGYDPEQDEYVIGDDDEEEEDDGELPSVR
jgi:hypothetical protein